MENKQEQQKIKCPYCNSEEVVKRGTFETKAHGFIFQNWVIRTFLSMTYSGEWDIPAKINPISKKPVSIKTAQWESGLGLGDVLNQFKINEDFERLVAFYINNGKRKKVVNMVLVSISKDKWRELWGNMTLQKLESFDKLVRSEEGRNLKGKELDDFRANVQVVKKDLLKDYTGKFTINPKIDSENQRRVQCGLGFDDLFSEFGLGESKKQMKTYNLWGREIKLGDIRLE
jgi:hypothetical protein